MWKLTHFLKYSFSAAFTGIFCCIAPVILFQFGSGLVKGFAVTLALGVIITMFTAIMFSRGIISMWFNKFKPTKLSI